MPQPPDKREPPQPEQHGGIWPPPPKTPPPRSVTAPTHNITYLTTINWLDAILGIPAGFLIGGLLYVVFSLCFQIFCKPPWHQPQMLTMCSVGAVLTIAACLIIGRKYPVFAFTMSVGACPLYLILLFAALL